MSKISLNLAQKLIIKTMKTTYRIIEKTEFKPQFFVQRKTFWGWKFETSLSHWGEQEARWDSFEEAKKWIDLQNGLYDPRVVGEYILK